MIVLQWPPTPTCVMFRFSVFRCHGVLEAIWNVMAHAQKPDFVFRRNVRVHLNRRGASVQSTTGSRGVRISGSNAGYTMFWGSVKSTGYPIHSPVCPSLLLPCVTVCYHISTGVYRLCPVRWCPLCRTAKSSSRCSIYIGYNMHNNKPYCTYSVRNMWT